MAVVKIWQNGIAVSVSFDAPEGLKNVLIRGGLQLDHPCGSRGICAKCAVRLSGAVSEPNAAEQKAGTRLSCQAVLLGDAEVWLPDTHRNEIELSGGEVSVSDGAQTGIGAAIDIGTTTLALKLYDLSDGRILAAVGAVNPQRSVAADVMGRIGAAMNGQGDALKAMIREALHDLLSQACGEAGISVDTVCKLVVTGNTTMLYLLEGRNPEALSHAPFVADCLFDEDSSLFGIPAYYPPCMNAFVGADITCAVLAGGLCDSSETALLCDIGTNGEMALWKDDVLYVTSTAAGPAFEGAGISCGCGSIPGAIDRVWVEGDDIRVHTIGDAPACGVCGSGLIDAIAAALKLELVDETGAMEDDDLPLDNGVCLQPRDVRAVQLAKAAIAAGMDTLMKNANLRPDQVHRVYIAGGFGSHLNVSSAAAIGLIPEELAQKVQVIGNAALTGAVRMLLHDGEKTRARAVAGLSRHVDLGGNPYFNERYMERMLFEET